MNNKYYNTKEEIKDEENKIPILTTTIITNFNFVDSLLYTQ